MIFSDFGDRFTGPTGIGQLMDDLTEAPPDSVPFRMLGGGNPAHIPAVSDWLRISLATLLEDPVHFDRYLGAYGAPGGLTECTEAISTLLGQHFQWNLTPANIALTNGSQNAFFLLFNLFGGARSATGTVRKIHLPLIPEYIGYFDVAVDQPVFEATRPRIEVLDAHTFKYRIDFDAIALSVDTGAVCVSRPTNPTGNVITDHELALLSDMTRQRNVPLIIDNAYGAPFPNIIHTSATLPFDEHTILCFSLSKLGLPALRTGIVIASETIVHALTRMNAVINLTPGSFGPALVLQLLRSGDIVRLSNDIIRPYYRLRAERALNTFRSTMHGLDALVHQPEGAFFLWMWFPRLTIGSDELYRRLKARGVIVVSGHHFFPGNDDWPHRRQCIRVSYAGDAQAVDDGIAIIAEEVRRASGHR